MAALDIIGVRKSYGALAVLRDISLAVEPGEFTVLLGPSGCGKSTLLHAIAGLEDLDAGTIRIGGEDVTDREPKDRGLAMVFQSYALYPTMSVERNLSYGLRVAGLPRAEVAARVAEAARLLQIEPLLARKPAQLSGGQRQRVAIGRAIVRQLPVFLFDEPLSNLDAKLRTEMRLEIKRLHAALGATIVYVTHDQVEAMTMATRIAVMEAGAVVQHDAPDALYARPASLFVAGFVGSPPMNLVPARLSVAGGRVRALAAGAAVPLDAYPFAARPRDGQEAILGLRPEDLAPGPPAPEAVAATVEASEHLGPEALVWARAADATRLCLRLSPDLGRALAGGVHLHADPRKASLFDPGTGLRL